MQDNLKNPKRKLYLSKNKIIVILIVTCCLVLGGLSPAINSSLIKKNAKTSKEDYNKKNYEEYKKTSYYDDDVYVFASFHWSPSYPDPGEKITFYSTSYASGGYVITESWEFEDGGRDYGSRTTHTYDKKGSYRVALYVTARGFNGGSDIGYSVSYVKVGADPFPRITCTPETPSPGEKVALDGSKSSDPDGKITSFNWSFYNVEDPKNITELGSDDIIYYTWKKQGIYVVSLFTEDDKGNNNTIQMEVHVSILRIVNFPTYSRGIRFEISNQGNISADNVNWNLKIEKYSLLRKNPRYIYQKDGTMAYLDRDNAQEIKVKDIRRAFCKIKLEVTANADNAVEVSKSFYGLAFGKLVYLSEDNFINPYHVMMFIGLLLAWILFLIGPILITT